MPVFKCKHLWVCRKVLSPTRQGMSYNHEIIFTLKFLKSVLNFLKTFKRKEKRKKISEN